MKKYIVALVAVVFTTLVAGARTYNIPVDEPKFSITFPKGWEVRVDEDEYDIYGISPDEEIEYYIWRLPDIKAGNIKEVLTSSMEDILEEVKRYVKGVEFGKFEYEQKNGLEVLWAVGSGKYSDGGTPVAVAIDLFSPDEKSFFCLLYYGSKAGQKEHADAIKQIDDSVKKL